MWEKISQWFADAHGPVTIDGVVYISNHAHTIAMFAVVIIFGFLWWAFWYASYRVWIAKYMRRKGCVPDDSGKVLTSDVGLRAREHASDMRKYIKRQCDFVTKARHFQDLNLDLDMSPEDKKRYLDWFDYDQMSAMLWFLYTIGIGVRLFRFDIDNNTPSSPPEGVDREYRWRPKHYDQHWIILLLLSSVSLMALAVFLI